MLKRSTPGELIGGCVLAAVVCASTYAAWRAGAYLALVVMVPLALLFLWGVIDMVRQGVRRPTAFERFEGKLFVRFIMVLLAGGAAAALFVWVGAAEIALVVGAITLAISLIAAGKLRGRHETSAGYKRRVGYRDPDHQE